MILQSKMITQSIITTTLFILGLLLSPSIGGLLFADAVGINASIAKNHLLTIATCIDQPVIKHIGYDNIFDAHDVSSLLHDNMMMSKVVDDADNGTCNIAMDNSGSALSITYHPTSGYVGQDKCTYKMCIVEDDGDATNAATKVCSELTIAIDVEDCSAVGATNKEDEVIGIGGEEYHVLGDEKVSYECSYDVDTCCVHKM